MTGAQELVREVPVAVLQIDKVEADVGCEMCRGREGFENGPNLGIGDRLATGGRRVLQIQNRMVISNPRFQSRFLARAAKAPRMRQLEADEEIVGGAEALPMSLDHLDPQPCQIRSR